MGLHAQCAGRLFREDADVVSRGGARPEDPQFVRVVLVDPDPIALLEPAQFGADVGHRGVGQKVGARHRALECGDAEDRCVEIDIAVLGARYAVEKDVVAGHDGPLRDDPVGATDVDANGLDQRDVLIFVEAIEVVIVEGVEAHGERLVRVQFDEGPGPVLSQDFTIEDVGLSGRCQKQQPQCRFPHDCSPQGRPRWP